MKFSEWREMTIAQLQTALLAALHEQFSLKMQHATRRLVATHKLRQIRCRIARLLTILTEKLKTGVDSYE